MSNKRNRTTLFEEELRSSKPRHAHFKNSGAYKKYGGSTPGSFNKNSNNGSKVVVKITGGSKDSKAAKRHIDYISRNNKVDLFDKDGNKVDYDSLQDLSELLIESDDGKEDSKKTYNIMFSTEGKNDSEKLKEAILKTAEEEFEGYDFFIAIHEDTDNTHGHLVVYRNSIKEDKRLEIRKGKLNSIKKRYSDNLNKVGIKSYFKSHSDKFKNNKNIHKFKKERIDQTYKVLDFGVAPYKFTVGQKDSFYLLLENKNGVKQENWSWGLKDALSEKNIKRGDHINIKKLNSNKDQFAKSVWSVEKVSNDKKEYSVVDIGKANYRFHEDTKESFYMLLENGNDIKQVWNKELEKFVSQAKINIGSNIELTKDNVVFTSEKLKEDVKITNEVKPSLKI